MLQQRNHWADRTSTPFCCQLIDHEDFQDLNHDYKQKIAPTELVQQLIDMGLLCRQITQPPVKNEIKEDLSVQVNEVNSSETSAIKEVSEINTVPVQQIQPENISLEKTRFCWNSASDDSDL